VVDQVDEQHDGVGVVLDRYQLMERCFVSLASVKCGTSTFRSSRSKLAANAGRSRTSAMTPS